MEDRLIEILNTFDFPVYRQGSIAEGEKYPDTFFTFWNNAEYENTAHDNNTTSVIFDFDVNVYSTNPATTYNLLKDARTLLKRSGFVTPSRGYDVASDEPSHTGRGMSVLYNGPDTDSEISVINEVLDLLNELLATQESYIERGATK